MLNLPDVPKGLTDDQIQLISGHESKKSLEVYQHLSLECWSIRLPRMRFRASGIWSVV